MRGAAENDAAHYGRAEAILTKAIRARPTDPVALIQRGRCYWREGKNELAVEDFASAIKLQPGLKLTIQALKSKIAADQSLKNWPAALADCNQLIKLNVNDPYAYNHRSFTYQKLGQLEQAKKDADQCIRIAPRTKEYLRATSIIKTDGGPQTTLKEALAFLDMHIKNHPNDGAAHYERASVNAQLYRQKETLADYDDAIRLEPDRFTANTDRAGFLASVGRYKEAILGYSDGLQLAPGNDHMMLDRAACYTKLSDWPNSIKDYSALIELHPDDEDPVHYRARVYTQIKDYARALTDYDRTIKLAPDQAALYSERSKVYEKLGKHDLAAKDEQKASALLAGPPKF